MKPLAHPPLKVAWDIDGVLADFTTAFRRLIKDELGKDLKVPRSGPTTWDWHLDGGVTKQENEHLWWLIGSSPDFWNHLMPYPNAVMTIEKLEQLTNQGLILPYFITSRPGATAHDQSVQWLRRWGISAPQVLVAKNSHAKGVLALGLDIHAAVDDNAENAIAFARAVPDAYILEWPYNAHATAPNLRRMKTPYAVLTAMLSTELKRRNA